MAQLYIRLATHYYRSLPNTTTNISKAVHAALAKLEKKRGITHESDGLHRVSALLQQLMRTSHARTQTVTAPAAGRITIVCRRRPRNIYLGESKLRLKLHRIKALDSLPSPSGERGRGEELVEQVIRSHIFLVSSLRYVSLSPHAAFRLSRAEIAGREGRGSNSDPRTIRRTSGHALSRDDARACFSMCKKSSGAMLARWKVERGPVGDVWAVLCGTWEGGGREGWSC